ncbi:hypothetical protein [Bosea sp. PAMC 26642]|uniref:hypothetical protein n=1 Tax=Bosea sp. (strain PAMC 26642) TaxID=1792307 RepID=UPI0012E8A3F6|nr:hypothetical protein [Bosea sp. PAMC 26642]
MLGILAETWRLLADAGAAELKYEQPVKKTIDDLLRSAGETDEGVREFWHQFISLPTTANLAESRVRRSQSELRRS